MSQEWTIGSPGKNQRTRYESPSQIHIILWDLSLQELMAESTKPSERGHHFAIKKFKPDKEGEGNLSAGLSQSACREIGLCRELKHVNIVGWSQFC